MSTKVKGDKIKEGSIPLSALDDKSNRHLKDWGMYDYVGKLGEGVLELPFNYYQCIIYDNTKKKIHQIMYGQSATLQSFPKVMVNYDGHIVTLDDSDNVYSNRQIFVYKGIETINNAYLPTIETPTPNWNANEAELGYIENKPFGVSSMTNTYFGNSHWEINDGEHLYVAKSSYNDIYIDDVGYFSFSAGMSQTFSINGAGEITVKNSGGIPIITNQDYFDTEEEAAEFLNNVLKIVTIDELDSTFLPNTVLKTTPQNLSNTDKTQALSNLGIDPVVWKYMMNPIRLFNNITIVPEEFIGEKITHPELGEVYLFKYLIPQMYIIIDADIHRAPSIVGPTNNDYETLGFWSYDNMIAYYINAEHKVVGAEIQY